MHKELEDIENENLRLERVRGNQKKLIEVLGTVMDQLAIKKHMVQKLEKPDFDNPNAMMVINIATNILADKLFKEVNLFFLFMTDVKMFFL